MNDVIFRIERYNQKILAELDCMSNYQDVYKDILIIVHNQLFYLKKCVESIRRNTKNYQIYIWNNNSDQETKSWIESQKDIICSHHDQNIGFIKPNNELMKISKNPYAILLNSDTEVLPNWDKAMIGQIQQYGYAQVGYLGGKINESGKGTIFNFGSDIDYICGWCFCIPRFIYEKYGLFDEEYLHFAYCEDSDFSLRLTESNEIIYALHLGLVTHHENKTIKEVMKTTDCEASFIHNHEVIKKRWSYRFFKS